MTKMEEDEIREIVEFMRVCNSIEYCQSKNFEYKFDTNKTFLWKETPQGHKFWSDRTYGVSSIIGVTNFID